MPDALRAHLVDAPDLAAGFAVWLCSGQSDSARGRYLSANRDVGGVTALKDEILARDLLVNRPRAKP